MAGTVQPFAKIEPPPFECGAATHVGLVRRRNEDNYLVQPDSGIWAVADGMGGHQDGHIASKLIVEALQSVGRPNSAADLLTRCEASILSANSRIRLLATERGGHVIGSTVAILLIHERHYACLWSGDSRIYRVRDGALVQLSRDHTQVRELVESGHLSEDEAKKWPGRNVITRAIGVKEEPELEVQDGPLMPADVFLICSDGLTDHVPDSDILAQITNHRCQDACDALVQMTLARGARDNVTVVAVRYAPLNDPSGDDNVSVRKIESEVERAAQPIQGTIGRNSQGSC